MRIEADVAAAPTLLPASRSLAHDPVEELAPQLRDSRVVVVCQKGEKLSQGAAAMLRADGVRAETLAGGHLGWREAGLPLVPIDAIPPRDAEGLPALRTLATLVRAADTDRPDLTPQAAGLLAASLGFSRMFRDDLAQLAAATMVLYDALYRWARDAQDESHDEGPR